jgi:hypothetical protein
VSQWNERYKEHPVWKLLDDVGPAIDQAMEREGNDAQAAEMLSRLKAVHIYIARRLAGADRYLLTVGPLDNINSSFVALLPEVRSFVANGNAGHLTNANGHADSALAHVAELNVLYTTEDFQGAKEAADSYRRSLDSGLASSITASTQNRAELEALRARMVEFNTEITNEKQRVVTVGTEFQSQFSTAQETRNREFLEGQRQRLENFTKVSTEYTQKLSDQNADFTKQREEIGRTHRGELDQLNKEFVAASTEIRDQILARKGEVEKLVGVIGNLGVTSGYLKSANTAMFTARVWQTITVVALTGLILIAYAAFLPLVHGEFTWSGFAGRVFVSLTVAVLAAYSASQADRYQKFERSNRRLALELEAIGPFIAPLPAEMRQQFLLTVGDRSFGQPDESHFGTHTKSPATMLDLVLHSKELRSLITDIVKAAKS